MHLEVNEILLYVFFFLNKKSLDGNATRRKNWELDKHTQLIGILPAADPGWDQGGLGVPHPLM